jgi:CubicO group peptidase (beta-lactamase class C family)
MPAASIVDRFKARIGVKAHFVLVASLLTSCATIQRPGDDAGVEVGVAFDRGGERGSYVFGIADPATGRGVTIDDPVRIASVSKLVVGIGVMKLVEERRVTLDEDVSGILGWPLRNPAFPSNPVTLRMLLSHTSTVRDYQDQYAVPLGGTVKNVMLDQRSWDLTHAPGIGYFRYANMNFPIVASVVETVTGERFDKWMRREVLAPLKLDACFNWVTCSDAAVARAVVLTQAGKPVRDDLGGVRPPCPVQAANHRDCDLARWRKGENGALFAPQGGLRISGRSLARIGRLLLNNGVVDGVRVLSPASVRELLRSQWRFSGSNGDTEGFYCSYGLATQQIGSQTPNCNDDPIADRVPRVGHAGEAYGLRSGLWIDTKTGTGVAYFRTGLATITPGGRSGFRAAEESAFRRAIGLFVKPN